MQRERHTCFKDIEAACAAWQVLADIPHPQPQRYPGQRLLMVRIADYAYVVPYLLIGDEVNSITLYASRTATRRYLRGEQ